MAFRKKTNDRRETYESPEEMFSKPEYRSFKSVPGLWVQQGDALRAYAEKHKNTRDLAIELPTGTGKTLPGLIIAEWARQMYQAPVLYATPTRQLADQVAETAANHRMPASVLTGSSKEWHASAELSVRNAHSIGITTYSSIFNSNPRVPEPRMIIFDDAHAGEQYVGNQYAVNLTRGSDEESYRHILDCLAPYMSKLEFNRLSGKEGSGIHDRVRMIIPASNSSAIANLDAALASLPSPYNYQYRMIRNGLASCMIYVAFSEIQIRPMIPPTFDNKVFANAEQRIYLSATLGSGGELERSFGVPKIERMEFPESFRPRAGRRLFVFPDISAAEDKLALVREIFSNTDKAILLSQDSSSDSLKRGREISDSRAEVLGRDELSDLGLDNFKNLDKGLLSLSNRYDGTDLPGDTCRMVILDGLPDSASLQERWLSERAQSRAVLSERLRTRIVQGSGRCTRGPNDYAVVVVLGRKLTSYLGTAENLKTTDPELQAEVEFGVYTSDNVSESDIIENIRTFLEQGEEWSDVESEEFTKYLSGKVKETSSVDDSLGKSAEHEVLAWRLAYEGHWIEASKTLSAAFGMVGGDQLRGYRSLLNYLCGFWMFQGANSPTEISRAQEFMDGALVAAGANTWVREMPDRSEMAIQSNEPMDNVALRSIVGILQSDTSKATLEKDFRSIISGLSGLESGPYERSLTLLGKMLGADSYKPKGQARCDSAWLWGDESWLTLEAKSEHAAGTLSPKDIRQTNTQLDKLAADRDLALPPQGSASVIISDRSAPHRNDAQTANSNVFLVDRDTVLGVAHDVLRAWKELIATRNSSTSQDEYKRYVLDLLGDSGCLPSSVIDRLCEERIRPASWVNGN